MTSRLCLLFILGTILTGTTAVEQIEVDSATSRTVFQNKDAKYGPEKAVDGKTTSFYSSDESQPDQWLKLTLKEPASVGNVVIINR